MPFLFLITFVSGTMCYFMVRLHPGFMHYLFFVLCLYASVTVVESLMMAIASVIPNFLMGIIIGAGIQVNLISQQLDAIHHLPVTVCNMKCIQTGINSGTTVHGATHHNADAYILF
jgi:hypothetical protein